MKAISCCSLLFYIWRTFCLHLSQSFISFMPSPVFNFPAFLDLPCCTTSIILYRGCTLSQHSYAVLVFNFSHYDSLIAISLIPLIYIKVLYFYFYQLLNLIIVIICAPHYDWFIYIFLVIYQVHFHRHIRIVDWPFCFSFASPIMA